MKRILFQGDSITDSIRSRDRQDEHYRGSGYATMVSGYLGAERPNEFEFINRGIGGNKIVDLLARVKRDIINLTPDYISILIGINDVGQEISRQDGTSAEKSWELYNMLVKDIKSSLPDVKIMLLEPFVLKESSTAEKWDLYRKEVEKRAELTKRVALDNELVFVPLMKVFDEAAKIAPPGYWLRDGIHPTAAGHELIKRAWIEGFDLLENK